MKKYTSFECAVRLVGITSLVALAFLLPDSKVTTSRVDNSGYVGNCIMKRTSENKGLHRQLKTKVSIPVDVMTDYDDHQMDMVLIEHIPSGMYVDLFEIKSAAEFGGPQVHSFENIDIEKPKYLSTSHDILVFGTLQRKTHFFITNISLPVHLRYHKPSGATTFDEVILPNPELFIKTTDNDDMTDVEEIICQPSKEDMCKWKKISCVHDPRALSFSVPVGKTSHKDIVVYGTLIITVAATAFLGHSVVQKDTGKLKSP